MQLNTFRSLCRSLLVSAPLFALLACSSSGPKAKAIDNALLADLSDEERAPIALARSARDEAGDALAVAAKELKNAPERVKMGKANLDSEKAAHAKSKLAAEYAKNSGTPEEAAAAAASLEFHSAMMEAAKLEVELNQREYELAKISHKMAEGNLELAEAKIEATKARAVKGLNLAATAEIDPDLYQSIVENRTQAVEKLRQKLADRKSGIKEMRDRVVSLQNSASAMEPR